MRVTDHNAFAFVREVLRGERTVPVDYGAAKMMHLFSDTNCDIRIAPSVFEIWPCCVPRRRPFEYYPRLAPAFVGDVMSAMDATAIVEPMVGVLRPGPRLGPFVLKRCGAWVIPNLDEVWIRLRQVANDAHTTTMPIPTDGEWSLPARAPQYKPEPKRYVNNELNLTCPHCKATPARFREISNAWICEQCGRSFST